MAPFRDLIREAANQYSLDPAKVAGLVSVESGFNPWAMNPEPNYRYLWDVRKKKPFREIHVDEIHSRVPPPDFFATAGDPDHEWHGQAVSWGLTQVMGAVAREYGFDKPFLSELCDPKTNLNFGCKHLANQLKWAKGDYEQALAAYNGGKFGNAARPFRNAAYAAKVLKASEQYRIDFM